MDCAISQLLCMNSDSSFGVWDCAIAGSNCDGAPGPAEAPFRVKDIIYFCVVVYGVLFYHQALV